MTPSWVSNIRQTRTASWKTSGSDSRRLVWNFIQTKRAGSSSGALPNKTGKREERLSEGGRKQGLLVLVLLVFARVGVAHIINPDWFVNRSGVRKGGQLANRVESVRVSNSWRSFRCFRHLRLVCPFATLVCHPRIETPVSLRLFSIR